MGSSVVGSGTIFLCLIIPTLFSTYLPLRCFNEGGCFSQEKPSKSEAQPWWWVDRSTLRGLGCASPSCIPCGIFHPSNAKYFGYIKLDFFKCIKNLSLHNPYTMLYIGQVCRI